MEELKSLKRDLERCLTTVNRLLGGETPSAVYADLQTGARVIQKNGKSFVEIDNKDWFHETCRLLSVHPKAEGRDTEALTSLPQGLNKYGSLTEGQWKLFKALHNKLLGSWPDVPPVRGAAPVTQVIPEDLESIPF